MKLWKFSIAAALVVLTASCAGTGMYRDAREEEQLGHWDLAVMKYAKAAELDPSNSGFRTALIHAKLRASEFHFEKGKMYRAAGRPDLAVIELEQAVVARSHQRLRGRRAT